MCCCNRCPEPPQLSQPLAPVNLLTSSENDAICFTDYSATVCFYHHMVILQCNRCPEPPQLSQPLAPVNLLTSSEMGYTAKGMLQSLDYQRLRTLLWFGDKLMLFYWWYGGSRYSI